MHLSCPEPFKFLFDCQQGWLKYILKSVTLTLSVGMPLAILLGSIFPGVRTVEVNPVDDWLFLLFLGPFVETFLLAGILLLLRLVSKDLIVTCLLSAVIWALIHGVAFPIQGVVNFFNFLVFSIVFLVWQAQSFWRGFNLALLVHILHNTGVFAVVMVSEYFYL